MSVEKVNQYKDYKKNKKQILEQERKKQALYRAIGYAALIVVAAAFVIMIGLTAKNQYKAYKDSQPDYSASQMVVSDMTGILDSLSAEAEPAETDSSEAETAQTESTEAAQTEAADGAQTEAEGTTEAN